MGYNNLTYAVINVNDLDKVNYDQILNNGAPNIALRTNTSGSNCIIKWATPPSFIYVDELIDPLGIYTHQQILQLLQTTEWLIEE